MFYIVFIIKWLMALILTIVFSVGMTSDQITQKPQGADTGTQSKFIKLMLPHIREGNQKLIEQRSYLVKIHDRWLDHESLSSAQTKWIDKLAKQYQVSESQLQNATGWNLLLKRVDVIPAALILAQSINESAWGHSRFAREGDNYFGQWCYSKGCGIVPKHRPKGAIYEVKKFPSIQASVESYMHIINTGSDYKGLRDLREKLRAQGKPVTGIMLTAGLTHYSQRGRSYDYIIRDIIEDFHLTRYDTHVA